jgi:hypothetical protein
MSFDGSGNFLRIMNWQDDAAAGIKIKSDRHDQQDDDFANGLSNAITKDGQSSPVADIPMNGKKLINLGAPAAAGDAANKAYVDAIKTFSTNLDLSGADANGRINFTAATGANGIAWTGADLSWIARLAEVGPPAKANRLVLNDKPDGTGTDVVTLNENGSASFAGLVKAKALSQIQADTGNVHIQFLGPADVHRGYIYTAAAAVGHMVFSTAAGHAFYMLTDGGFQSPGRVYSGAGASFLETNGNIIGSLWNNWGAGDAYNAINARIESRAQAWANAVGNNCVQSMRAAGYVEYIPAYPTGADVTYSGYYVTRVWRRDRDEYRFGFRQIQMYIPTQGWIQATAW